MIRDWKKLEIACDLLRAEGVFEMMHHGNEFYIDHISNGWFIRYGYIDKYLYSDLVIAPYDTRRNDLLFFKTKEDAEDCLDNFRYCNNPETLTKGE